MFAGSFIRIRKNKGPSTDPCGTSVQRVFRLDFLPFT